MFYIISNETKAFCKTGRRGEPSIVVFSADEYENMQYAQSFGTREEADELLRYWTYNNSFDGRVITRQEAEQMVK